MRGVRGLLMGLCALALAGCASESSAPQRLGRVIVVGGGKGGHSAVVLPWALHSDAVYEAVRLPDGNYAKNIADFRQTQHA